MSSTRQEAIAAAKRETGEAILALADDTNKKLNADVLDRTYVIEDLLARMVEIAKIVGADVTLFEVGNVFDSHVCAYPFGGQDDETTQELPRMRSIVSNATLREVHNKTQFDGITRHPFEASPESSGMSCTRMVMRDGGGDQCGKAFDNAIHDWMW